MSERPTILAVDDELASIQTDVDGDAETAIADARERLAEFDARNATSQEALLEDGESLLLRAEERVDGELARRLEAIRNRIRIYRERMSETVEDLAVIDTTLRVEGAEERDASALAGRTVDLIATVVNGGTDRRVLLAVGFYDENDEEIDEIATDEVRFEADEQSPMEVEIAVPEGAAYYAVSALDAETQTVG